MKLLKNVLIGFGVLFVAVIGLFIFAGVGSSDFREQQAPFIESFMHEFTQSWDVSAVHSKLSNDLLKQIDTPSGRNALDVFRTLGAFDGMSDLVLQHYTSGTSGKTGKFAFKAQFTSGPALVEMILVESEGRTVVNGLHITPSADTPLANTRHEA